VTSRRTVVVTRRAAADIDAADAWWHEHRPAAPGAVHEELARAFDLIAVHPGIGAAARSSRLKSVRRVHLSRIRYHVYYRASANTVEVLALWHASRGRGPDL